jgi:hypothetical protein
MLGICGADRDYVPSNYLKLLQEPRGNVTVFTGIRFPKCQPRSQVCAAR